MKKYLWIVLLLPSLSLAQIIAIEQHPGHKTVTLVNQDGTRVTCDVEKVMPGVWPADRVLMQDAIVAFWNMNEGDKAAHRQTEIVAQLIRKQAAEDSLSRYQARLAGYTYRKAKHEAAGLGSWTFTEQPPVKPPVFTEVLVKSYIKQVLPAWATQ